MMPNFDTARVRVLLEQLCELEPAWFWHLEPEGAIATKSDYGTGVVYAVQILPNGDAKIHVPTIRDALEALHDARGWAVTVYTGTYGAMRESWCEIVMLQPVYRVVKHSASTRLEATLEATNKALGGAS